jgi:phosphatidate cytidylyltransferase
MSKNLIARIAVAIVFIPIILWICYQGGWWLFGMIALFAALGIFEYLWAEGYRLDSPGFWWGLAPVAAVFAQMAVGMSHGGEAGAREQYFANGPIMYIVFVLVAAMGFAVGRIPPDQLFKKFTHLLWGVLYIAALYPIVFLLGAREWLPYHDAFSGGDCLLFLFGIIWVGDTFAMWIGAKLGRHKLAPTVSPNKTVEGFVGGLIGAALIGILMIFWKFDGLLWYHVLAMAIGCSLFGQLGDLVESMWKRTIGIKDSSAIIPGHGGVLDRFDSLLFAAPFMYAYLAVVIAA